MDSLGFDSAPKYLEFVLGFIVFIYALETYLDLRQWRCYASSNKVPPELSKHVKEDTFLKAKEQGLAKLKFGLVRSAFDTVHSIAVLYFGVPWLWNLSLSILLHYGYTEEYEVTRSAVFLVIGSVYLQVINIPFSLYSTFVLEEQSGSNKQTLKGFVFKKVMGILSSPLLGILYACSFHLIFWVGLNFWICVWALTSSIPRTVETFYPLMLVPFFKTFTPLPDGELKTAIEELAKKVQFPLAKLYVVNWRIPLSHINGYVYGLFNKRVVLYDTLLSQVDTTGILAILGREFANQKMTHVMKNLAIAQARIFVPIFLFSQIKSSNLYGSFGFTTQPVFIGLVLFSYLYTPVSNAFGLLANVLSRHFEYQADRFSTDLGFRLQEPLAIVHAQNLGNMSPDPWYSAYHFAHPTLLERIKALNEYQAKKK